MLRPVPPDLPRREVGELAGVLVTVHDLDDLDEGMYYIADVSPEQVRIIVHQGAYKLVVIESYRVAYEDHPDHR